MSVFFLGLIQRFTAENRPVLYLIFLLSKKFFCFFLALPLFSVMVSAQVSLVNLMTENTVNPVGLDVTQPRFTWQLNSEREMSARLGMK